MNNEKKCVDSLCYWAGNPDLTTTSDPCHFGWCTNTPASVSLRVRGRRAPEIIRACTRCAKKAEEKYSNVEILGRTDAFDPSQKNILMDAPKEEQIEAILLASMKGFMIEELSEKISLAPHRVRAHVRELERKGLLVRQKSEGTYMDTVWHYPDDFDEPE
jgi:DNA-binding MarR family transcriptional regulator